MELKKGLGNPNHCNGSSLSIILGNPVIVTFELLLAGFTK